MIIDDLSLLPDSFKEGIRGIVLLHRNKDGCIGNAQRKSIKKISRGVDEWTEIVQNFRELQQNSYPGHRIYASVNLRDMHKAIHEFRKRELEANYFEEPFRDWFYIDVMNNFFSCLMNPSARNTSYFLVDCDSAEEYNHAKIHLPNELIIHEYRTKNGHHIITHPYNPNEIKVPAKKDELLYIG